MKTKHVIYAGLGALAAAGFGYLVFKKFFAKAESAAEDAAKEEKGKPSGGGAGGAATKLGGTAPLATTTSPAILVRKAGPTISSFGVKLPTAVPTKISQAIAAIPKTTTPTAPTQLRADGGFSKVSWGN